MALFPNVDCVIVKDANQFDRFGQRVMGTKRTKAKCGVVRLRATLGKTSIRTDVSASQGHAEEVVEESVLLFLPRVSVEIGDMVEVLGQKLRVTSVQPRVSLVTGQVDMSEVRLDTWREGA